MITRILKATILSMCLVVPAISSAQEELAPPDVDFFLETLMTRTDFREFGLRPTEGFTLRGGIWFNAIQRGDWEFAFDGALHWMGEERQTRSFNEDPNTPGFPVGTVSARVREQNKTRINGYEFGFRAMLSRALHIRAGGFLYSNSQRINQDLTLTLDDTSIVTFSRIPQSSEDNEIGPYLQAGFRIPLLDTGMAILADYGHYWIGDERLENMNVGLQFDFR